MNLLIPFSPLRIASKLKYDYRSRYVVIKTHRLNWWANSSTWLKQVTSKESVIYRGKDYYPDVVVIVITPLVINNLSIKMRTTNLPLCNDDDIDLNPHAFKRFILKSD